MLPQMVSISWPWIYPPPKLLGLQAWTTVPGHKSNILLVLCHQNIATLRTIMSPKWKRKMDQTNEVYIPGKISLSKNEVLSKRGPLATKLLSSNKAYVRGKKWIYLIAFLSRNLQFNYLFIYSFINYNNLNVSLSDILRYVLEHCHG